MTVDLPEPVGPTSAKNSASVKSILAGSRNEANPSISSTIGRISTSFSGPADSGGDLVVQLREYRRHSLVPRLLGVAVVGEQLIRRRDLGPGNVTAVRGNPEGSGELRVDAYLECVRHPQDRVPPHPAWARLAQPPPQVVLPERAGLRLELGQGAPDRPQPPSRGDRYLGHPGRDRRGRLDQADHARVGLLAKVDRDRRAAVVDWAVRGQRLTPVQMPERHVVRRYGEDRGREAGLD